jgi:Brp/Blh family beta-carotene 15,15'-monooxygenase
VPTVTATVVLVLAGLGLVAGVPHGAADHVMAARLAGGRPMALVAAAYAAVAVAAWALLEWAGPIALIAVVALSALHFGLGELQVWRQLTGWRTPRVLAIPLVIAGSGALVLPLARSGDQLRGVATAVSPDLALLIGGARVQICLVAIWLAAALIAVIASLWSRHPTVALDIVLVGALGILVPPLVAFAVWFGGWHALRHCARILTIEPGCAALVKTGRQRAAALRLIWLAAVPSIAALTAVAALGWFTVAASDPAVVLAEVLRLLLALTVPHMVVVLWVDQTADRRYETTVSSTR